LIAKKGFLGGKEGEDSRRLDRIKTAVRYHHCGGVSWGRGEEKRDVSAGQKCPPYENLNKEVGGRVETVLKDPRRLFLTRGGRIQKIALFASTGGEEGDLKIYPHKVWQDLWEVSKKETTNHPNK